MSRTGGWIITEQELEEGAQSAESEGSPAHEYHRFPEGAASDVVDHIANVACHCIPRPRRVADTGAWLYEHRLVRALPH